MRKRDKRHNKLAPLARYGKITCTVEYDILVSVAGYVWIRLEMRDNHLDNVAAPDNARDVSGKSGIHWDK